MQTIQTCPLSLVECYGVNALTLEDRAHFKSVLKNLSQPISDYTFANNFMWVNSFRIYWKTIYNHLCVFIIENDLMHMFLPPCPEEKATLQELREAIFECYRIMNDYNHNQGNLTAGTIQYISDEMMQKISTVSIEGLIFMPSPMGKDYVYDMEKMISLSGASFDSKRHARNKFIRLYPDFETRTITEKDIPGCQKLLHTWYNHKNVREDKPLRDSYEYYLDPEKIACEMAFNHAQELDLKGMALYVKDELIGFTYGQALSQTQASILIEKTHPDYYGAPALIFSEFCRQYWSEFSECNAGDHGNSPNLHFTKQQYRPVKYLNKSIAMQAKPIV